VLIALAGCVPQSEAPVPKSMMLRLGMGRDEVLQLLGRPRAIETHGTVEFWLYAPDASDQQALFLPVGLLDGRVIGWGQDYYDKASRGVLSHDGSVPRVSQNRPPS